MKRAKIISASPASWYRDRVGETVKVSEKRNKDGFYKVINDLGSRCVREEHLDFLGSAEGSLWTHRYYFDILSGEIIETKTEDRMEVCLFKPANDEIPPFWTTRDATFSSKEKAIKSRRKYFKEQIAEAKSNLKAFEKHIRR